MTQQPDNLFKRKLENHSRPAPAGAWDRIEAGLNKKKYKGHWHNIAAAVLLLAATSFILLQIQETDPFIATTGTDNGVEKSTGAPDIQTAEPESPKETIAPDKPVHEIEEASPDATPAVAEKKEADMRSNVSKTLRSTTSVAQTKTEPIKPAIVTTPEPANVSESLLVDQQSSALAENTAAEESSIKWVIDAKEAREKYLDKKALAKATSEEQKSSGLKKLLGKAYDLKTNQDQFGELRHIKNEILAFNFQGNKKQEQNK